MSDSVKQWATTCTAAIVIALGSSIAHAAPNAALSFTNATNWGNSPGYILGYDVTPNVNVVVGSLGYYDHTPGDSLNSSHEIGIFYTSGPNAGTLIAPSIFVQPNDPLYGDPSNGFFRYHKLATPISLSAGTTYRLLTQTNTGGPDDGFAYGSYADYSGLVFDPRIAIGGSYVTQLGGLSYSNDPSAFQLLGTPNMIVPEPATASLLVGGLVFVLRRRRRGR